MTNSRIVVLASNSFAGSAYVAHALSQGAQVIGVSRSAEAEAIFLPYKKLKEVSNFHFFQVDINHDLHQVCSLLMDFKPDVVVDFAGQGMVAESWQAPEQWYQTNIVSKVKLHHFLKDKSWLKRYIRISTPEVYGNCDKLIDETQSYRPSTPYAVSHAAIDMSLFAFYQQYGFPVVFGRFANFYGEHQQLYRIIPKTILCALSGVKLPLHGGGHSIRAFIHSTDVARGIEKMVHLGNTGEVYHFSHHNFHSIRSVVECICNHLNVEMGQVVKETPDRPGKDKAYLMNATKAKRELEWSPQISFEEGIERSIEWIRRHYEKMQQLPWAYIHKA